MSCFSGPLRTEKRLYKEKTKFLWLIPYTRQRHFWVTLEAFSFFDDEGNKVYTVPKDFPTDFSSVPPGPLRMLFPKDDVDSQASVGHDWEYHSNKPHSVVELPPDQKKKTKPECDKNFLSGMKTCGQTSVKRRLKYWGVKFGGWYGWNKKDKEISDAG